MPAAAEQLGSSGAMSVKQRFEALGTYEREAVESVLARRKLDIDYRPEGKRLREVLVENLNVFSKGAGPLRYLNFIHITTRDFVIAREVLLEKGDEWDATIAEETRRRLNDPLFTSLVVVVPIAASATEFDLLVVTRDIWSLRMNSNWEIQGAGVFAIPGFGGKIIELTLAPSENNFLGLRKQLAAVFSMDLGQFSFGPQFIDKNIAGTRMQLRSRFLALFAREGGAYEGTSSTNTLSYPLWSFRRKWAASLKVSHFNSVVRRFRDEDLFPYDNPDTAEIEEIPWIYDDLSVVIRPVVTRSFGVDEKHNLSFGYQYRNREPAPQSAFPADEVTRQAFIRDVLPRAETSSALVASYAGFTTNQYSTFRNLNTYDLAEDRRLGPSIETEVSVARKEFGSTHSFVGVGVGMSYALRFGGDGFLSFGAASSTRIQAGNPIDNNVSATGFVASPSIYGLARLVARSSVQAVFDNQNNTVLLLGGSNGLRGYLINAYDGEFRWLTNAEVRTRGLKMLFFKVGGVAFWDMGHAAESVSELSLKHDVGFGARILVPQLQSVVFRLDLAFALSKLPAGQTGRTRFIFGIQQGF